MSHVPVYGLRQRRNKRIFVDESRGFLMLASVLLLFVGVLPSVQAAPHVRQDLSDSLRQQRDSTGTVDPLDSFSPEVTQTYDKLHLPQTRAERLSAYAQLSSAMKSAVWIHQFRVALAQHPEFTAEQRDVLGEAIALFTPELFEIDPSSPDWGRRVDAPLQALTYRVKVVFGIALAAQLFTQLGPTLPHPTAIPAPDGNVSSPPTAPAGESRHATTLHPAPNVELPNCFCSTVNDYCALEFGPGWYCLGGGCWWGVNWGCGTGLLYKCDGLCRLS